MEGLRGGGRCKERGLTHAAQDNRTRYGRSPDSFRERNRVSRFPRARRSAGYGVSIHRAYRGSIIPRRERFLFTNRIKYIYICI